MTSTLGWVVIATLALAVVLYWQLVLAEGAHLGPRVVTGLYDFVAHRYDRLKRFDLQVEADTLGLPLAAALAEMDAPLVLDAASGTGRVARALLRQPAFDGRLVNVDLAARMIAHGRPTCAPWLERVRWVRSAAPALPFAAATFDAVTCLEALEFMPDPPAVLAECLRVLRPGGLLLTTNRVGRVAPLLPGKTDSRPAFQRRLAQLPLRAVRIEPWQEDYDLAWAWKAVPDAGVSS